jgi:peptide/nickel transport system ATP-binding protein
MLITCDGLVKIYQVAGLEVVALQGLDLTVQPGEMVGIVGASGSGKTTLLNILGGLDRPSAGQVRVGELDLLKASPADLDRYRREQVGFVWQQTTRNLVPYFTALENVRLPMLIGGREQQAWAEELLNAVGLWQRRRSRPSELSGGQQQRIAIAVALANRPGLLLGDEPTGELDTQTAGEIMALLHQVNEQYETSVILVTHDAATAAAMSRVVTIRDGRTSVETVRRAADAEPHRQPRASEVAGGNSTGFDEYLVVDAAGRLQLPEDLIEQAGIGRRVRAEPVEGGVLLRPVLTTKTRMHEGHDGNDTTGQRYASQPAPGSGPSAASAASAASTSAATASPPQTAPAHASPSSVTSVVSAASKSAATPARPQSSLLTVTSVWRTYGQGDRAVHALRGVSLEVREGSFTALRGRSGSGKTTLLNCLAGLDAPTQGEVRFDGRRLAGFSQAELLKLRRQQIGFVFQSFALLKSYSAAENVELMLRLAGVPPAEWAGRVREALGLVGLARWADHRPHELSGGQQQRAAIARAIAARPGLILADEPTGELDSASGQAVLQLLRHIVDAQRATVVLATHDAAVDEFADTVFVLHDGRVEAAS